MLFMTLASCAASNIEIDLPYPHDADETAKQEWIDNKVEYLEKHHKQKVIDIKEDDESITFVFEVEPRSSKAQVEEENYTK